MVRQQILAFFLAVLACSQAFSQEPFKRDFKYVPLYQQIDHGSTYPLYCGAACLQMMMNGYPDPDDRVCFEQEHIYNKLQSQEPATADWVWSSPLEMQTTIHNLNHPAPPGRYEIFADVDRKAVMYSVLYWMTKRRYPTAVLVNGGSHWVVIRGFETNVNPITIDPETEEVELYSLLINDPAPPDCEEPWVDPCTPGDGTEGGCVRTVTKKSWYENEWKSGVPPFFRDPGEAPNHNSTLWPDQFVALVEPPDIQGTVADTKRTICSDLISPDDVIDLAKRHIVERRLHENKLFDYLVDTEPVGPHYVQGHPFAYYIVPFRDKNTGEIPGAMLLHALTGEFQEIAACKCRLRYLTETEAITHVMRAIDADPTTQFKAQLVFDWCRETSSRYQPLWEVEVFDGDSHRVLYVDQCGRVHPKLTYIP